MYINRLKYILFFPLEIEKDELLNKYIDRSIQLSIRFSLEL